MIEKTHINLTSLLIIIIAAVCATSCSKEPRYRIGVSQCSYDDWRLKLNDELERQALLYPEVSLEITSAYDDPTRQVDDIRRFIDEGVDVIITSPNNSENLNDILAEARRKGIKVLVFDRQPSKKNYDIFVSADNAMLGHAAGAFLTHGLKSDARILEITGTPTTSPALGRSKGFRRAIAENPGARCLASANGDWTEARAEAVADSLLRVYPEANAIYAHNDRMAIGARKAAIKSGHPDILIAGADAVPELGMRAVADGVIDATFIYPTAGKELIDLGVKAAKGEKIQDELIISTAQPVVKDNATILLEINQSIEDEKSKVNYLRDMVHVYNERHIEQRSLLIAIVSIVVLLALIIFILLRAYWQRRRSQEMLASRNAQLIAQRDELSQLNERLNEATSAKLVFFTNVSHDLRTPLTLIAEPVAQLMESPNLSPDERVLVRLADKNLRILRRLINQILDFRKYENGKLSLRLAEIDIRSYVEEWAESFRHLAQKRHVRFHLDYGPIQPPTLALDPEKMERIFFNLMSNAFKFTPANGEIRAYIALEEGKFILRVSDTGSGMDTDTLGHIFERFYQADKVQPHGSGIGLALVKAFVDLHEGDIRVESTPGKGTTFTVEIPERHIEQSSEESDENASAPATQHRAIGNSTAEAVEELGEISNPSVEEIDETKPCVLVIDDNADIRTMLRTLLGHEYTVLQASGGKQGVRLASRYIPDLIICDVMMPDMSGLECCRRLKGETTTSHIPILMLTACNLDEQRAEGYESGADGYLSKPFSAPVLLARCHALIENRRRLLAAKSQLDSPQTLTPAAEETRTSAQAASAAAPNRQDNDASGQAAAQTDASAKPASSASTRVKKTAANADLAAENEFYQRFIKIVESELSNANISVEEIGSRLGLSRVQFYRKIKALTNYSPNEILRIHRLKHAYRMLTSSESTVAEVAYSVGFSSPSYFAKCFKEYFNELPAEVQKRTSKI